MKRLAVFMRSISQTAYSILNILLQQGWQFVQRIIPGVGPLFDPLEVTSRDDFLTALLGSRREEFTNSLRKLITWGEKKVCIGISKPTHTTPVNFEMLEHCCEVITTYLLNGESLYLRAQATRMR